MGVGGGLAGLLGLGVAAAEEAEHHGRRGRRADVEPGGAAVCSGLRHRAGVLPGTELMVTRTRPPSIRAPGGA
jgi:hypothetical protein